ncbi:MAG: hypothetical protein WBN03_09425 [Desulfobacterales bacterium]
MKEHSFSTSNLNKAMRKNTQPKGDRDLRRYRQLCFRLIAVLIVLSGCSAFGPRTVSRDQFNYNKAVSDSTRNQMLLNLARIRYLEEPFFLSISSILTQYVYEGGAGVGTSIDLDGDADTVAAEANVNYEERPTITYIPIEGREFSERMLSAIPSTTMFAAAQQGWSVDILMRLGVNRIGAVENMSFEAIPPPGIIDLPEQYKRDVEKLKKFQNVINLLTVLADIEAFEVRQMEEDGKKKSFIIFAETLPQTTQSLVSEIKDLLDLSPHRNTFQITDHVTDVKEDEISIQTRSLSAMMAFMAKGVVVPPEHLANGWVIDYRIPTPEGGETGLIPFRMLSSKERPINTFAAVRYRDHWFYIENRDIDSKRALGLIIALFRVLAPTGGGAAPILTLPTG